MVERWFFPIKHRLRRFYKRFPWNAKYETIWSWLASFILYTLYWRLKVDSVLIHLDTTFAIPLHQLSSSSSSFFEGCFL